MYTIHPLQLCWSPFQVYLNYRAACCCTPSLSSLFCSQQCSLGQHHIRRKISYVIYLFRGIYMNTMVLIDDMLSATILHIKSSSLTQIHLEQSCAKKVLNLSFIIQFLSCITFYSITFVEAWVRQFNLDLLQTICKDTYSIDGSVSKQNLKQK